MSFVLIRMYANNNLVIQYQSVEGKEADISETELIEEINHNYAVIGPIVMIVFHIIKLILNFFAAVRATDVKKVGVITVITICFVALYSIICPFVCLLGYF